MRYYPKFIVKIIAKPCLGITELTFFQLLLLFRVDATQ